MGVAHLRGACGLRSCPLRHALPLVAFTPTAAVVCGGSIPIGDVCPHDVVHVDAVQGKVDVQGHHLCRRAMGSRRANDLYRHCTSYINVLLWMEVGAVH